MEKTLWPKVNWRIYSAVPKDLNSAQLLFQMLEAKVLDSMRSQVWSITVTRRNNENQKLWSVLPLKRQPEESGSTHKSPPFIQRFRSITAKVRSSYSLMHALQYAVKCDNSSVHCHALPCGFSVSFQFFTLKILIWDCVQYFICLFLFSQPITQKVILLASYKQP